MLKRRPDKQAMSGWWFFCKNAVCTPYIPINVWFWPTPNILSLLSTVLALGAATSGIEQFIEVSSKVGQNRLFMPYRTKKIRDGSYGLLRRPIRYNTLLIRNTRIIRKRIYAILGGTLGLHQPPSNHHELSPQPPEHYNH